MSVDARVVCFLADHTHTLHSTHTCAFTRTELHGNRGGSKGRGQGPIKILPPVTPSNEVYDKA